MSHATRDTRPDLVPPRSTLEMGLEALSLAALILTAVVAVTYWPRLPESIPMHFDLSGKPDGWGSRSTLVVLAVLPFVIWTLLTVLARFPHRFNYPWTITPENAARQYALSRTLLTALKIWTLVLLAHLLWRNCLVAIGEARGLGVAFLPLSLLALFLILLAYFVRAYRAR